MSDDVINALNNGPDSALHTETGVHRSISLTSLEICAGGGGQALGLERAGFRHVALVEIDEHSCNTLRKNRPNWNIIQGDVAELDGDAYRGVDLLAGGLPCPPFSMASNWVAVMSETSSPRPCA